MNLSVATLLLMAGSFGSVSASGATPTPAPNAPLKGCSEPEHRQLNFWIGEWVVYNSADNVEYAGSKIEPIENGCAIREIYTSPSAPGGAYSGTSYSAFDRKDRQWHQFYVDVNGTATWYSGGLDGKVMALTAVGPQGAQIKMVYEPQTDGSVRQIGTVSTDGGKSWKPGYDYTYRKRP